MRPIDLLISISLLIVLLLSACKKDGAEPAADYPAISYGFEAPLEEWVALGGGGERAQEEDILRSTTRARSGEASGRFRVSAESVVAGGTRAELTFDQGAGEGVLASYQWSMFLPADYPNTTLRDESGAPNWQVMGQWHQQPVWEEGEDWDNFTGQGASPPVAIYYNYLSRTDPDYIRALESGELSGIPGFDPTWDEVSVLSFVTGGETVLFATIEKDNWYDLRVDIYWSQGADGYIRVWRNGAELHDGPLHGATMLNKAPHYFKIGLYRNPTIQPVQEIWIDDISAEVP